MTAVPPPAALGLAVAGIKYVHIRGLGGLRHPRRHSPYAGWRNASFRGFADYMQTPEIEENLEELLDLARQQPTAIMWVEAVPWRCHRSLIGDALSVRGIVLEHITSAMRRNQHSLTPWARVVGLRITYPLNPYHWASNPMSRRRYDGLSAASGDRRGRLWRFVGRARFRAHGFPGPPD